jgi:cytoskeletal protein RodZ
MMIDRLHARTANAQAAAETPDAAKRGPVAVAKDAEMPTGTEWMLIGTRTANAQAAAEMPDAAMSASVTVAKDADEEERRLQPAVAMDRAKDTVCLPISTEIGT